jgi:hypothetical protein
MITQGDVLDVLKNTPDETYAACLTDPPYGLSFMGKRWDHGVPSSDVWAEVWRVLRPGAILMAFGGTRTWHRLAVNIEDAGFEMFDTIMWLYGSGFPKSTDIGKAIDKEAGAERTEGARVWSGGQRSAGIMGNNHGTQSRIICDAPATDAARTWAGYGSALKPAHEPILCFRKPRKATYAQTAQEWGTGALWTDGTRIPTDDNRGRPPRTPNQIYGNGNGANLTASENHPAGRWPANIILDEASAAALDEMSGERATGKPAAGKAISVADAFRKYARLGGGDTDEAGGASRFFQQCNIDEADRFFYAAKASRRERNRGLEGLSEDYRGTLNEYARPSEGRTAPKASGGPQANTHPCVKPLSLCEYLARLIVPPVAYRDDARLLVPFCGSGSEIIGALRAGWLHVDGIELEADYIEIARRRIAACLPQFAGD